MISSNASPELRADRDIVLAAVKTSGYAMQHASSELRADRVFVLAAVASNGYALRHASPELRADRAVVMGALANNRAHASAECLADRIMRRRGGKRRVLGRVAERRWPLWRATAVRCSMCLSRAPSRP